MGSMSFSETWRAGEIYCLVRLGTSTRAVLARPRSWQSVQGEAVHEGLADRHSQAVMTRQAVHRSAGCVPQRHHVGSCCWRRSRTRERLSTKAGLVEEVNVGRGEFKTAGKRTVNDGDACSSFRMARATWMVVLLSDARPGDTLWDANCLPH